MSVKILLYDLETGGTHPIKNGIHQIALRLFVDYKLVKAVKVNCRFNEGQEFTQEALNIAGKTIDQIMAYPFSQTQLYNALIKLLNANCDRRDKKDKIFLAGYNNHSFDNQFLRALWDAHKDEYFGSFFWSNSLDAMLMASSDLMMSRHLMPNFKLETVAAHYGFAVDKTKTHDADYDLDLTQFILQKLLGIQFQMAA